MGCWSLGSTPSTKEERRSVKIAGLKQGCFQELVTQDSPVYVVYIFIACFFNMIFKLK